MAASKIIVSENIEVPVVDGKIQCIRCRDWKLPGEMHFKDRICQACYETIRARNRDKPKPKKNNSKIIKKNAMGWIERNEKPTRVVGDSELAKMIILERATDRDILPEPITCDGFRVSETNNHPSDAENGKPESEDGFRVSETNDRPINNDSSKPKAEGGFTVSETTCDTNDRANRLPEELSDCIDGFRVSETNNHPSDMGIGKPESKDGFRVSETNNHPSDAENGKTESKDGFRVSETNDRPTNNDSSKPKAEGGFTVSDLQKQITDLEKHCGEQAEMLAKALRRIAALEEKTVPAIEKDDAKRDSDGMEKLRNDLHGILKEQYEKRKINGIYVKSLYGPNGRNGGVLGVSKATAWRLREACRLDKRFRVEKADNQKGNWTIRLNLYMN